MNEAQNPFLCQFMAEQELLSDTSLTPVDSLAIDYMLMSLELFENSLVSTIR